MDPVIIVGAGLGGLLLALLLEMPPPASPNATTLSPSPATPPKIPYIILERSTLRKMPVEGGGVIFLTPQIQPLLERLGILDELRRISRPVGGLTVYEPAAVAAVAAAAAASSGSGISTRSGVASPQGGGGKGGSASRSVSVLEQPDNQEPKESGVQGGALFLKTRFDYDMLAISRPELYNFLVDRIPEGKLMLGKQVQELVFQDIMTSIAHDGSAVSAPTPVSEVSVPAPVPQPALISGTIRSSGSTGAEVEEVQVQTEEVGAEKEGRASMMSIVDKSSATPTAACIATATPSTAAVVCTDGTRYEGTIVGADGAYSTVRLNLYRHLRERGLLAAAEEKKSTADARHGPMRSQFRVLVGMTRELDPDRFELLKSEYSDVRVLVSHNGVNPFMFWCVPMTGNKLCWMLDEQLAHEQICPEIEDFTQDQQAIHELCESVRSIPSPCSSDSGDNTISLGEIILDSTPSGTPVLLSREEGYFSTWTHGNVALMGDACHKALPYTGQPIAQAGQDAFKLANVLWRRSSMYHRSMYADSHRDLDDASPPYSPSSPSPTAGGILSFASISSSTSSSSHETRQTREEIIDDEQKEETGLRYWVDYEAERRAEAEHAVRQAGRFARLLMMVTRRQEWKGESAGSGSVGGAGSDEGLEVREVDGSFEEGREGIEKELQALLAELQH